jgi:hypothetical protein
MAALLCLACNHYLSTGFKSLYLFFHLTISIQSNGNMKISFISFFTALSLCVSSGNAQKKVTPVFQSCIDRVVYLPEAGRIKDY